GGVRPVPAAPADVIADPILGQTAQRLIERFDPHGRELLVLVDARLGIGHVPGVRQARVVELQYEARLDDGLVLFAHCLAESMEELLVRLVIPVLPPREASRCHRGDEPLLRLYLGKCGFEVREVDAERPLAAIGDRAGEHRRPAAERTRGAKARRIELAIKLGELQPVASPRECWEAARFARLPPTEASPGIARPGAVIDRPRRRLAVLAVIDDVDADLRLPAADLLDGGGQPRRVSARVVGLAGKLGAVDFDQRVGPRQAPDMRGKNPSVASLHGLRPPGMAPPAGGVYRTRGIMGV